MLGFYLLLGSVFAAGWLVGWVVHIDRRSADRTRHRIQLRPAYRKTLNVLSLLLGFGGSVLILNGTMNLLPAVTATLGGMFQLLCLGAYVLYGSGLLRVLPNLAELRLQDGGLWWFGRFTPWTHLQGAEMDSEQLRVDRRGNKSDLYLPAMFWQLEAEGSILLEAIGHQQPDFTTVREGAHQRLGRVTGVSGSL
jgi:hypothetical protein